MNWKIIKKSSSISSLHCWCNLYVNEKVCISNIKIVKIYSIREMNLYLKVDVGINSNYDDKYQTFNTVR